MGGASPLSNRWVLLSGALFAYGGLGFCENWALYSDDIKSTWRLDQSATSSIAAAAFYGNCAGLAMVPGFVNDRFGPAVTLCGAALFTALGMALFYATATGALPAIARLPGAGGDGGGGGGGDAVFWLSAFEAMRSFGNQWPSAAIMPLAMRNFEAQPALAIRALAALKCLSSAGGSLGALLFASGALGSRQLNFVLAAAVVTPTLFLCGVPFMRELPLPPAGDDGARAGQERHLTPTFALIVLLLALIVGGTVADTQSSGLGTTAKRALTAAVFALWLVAVLSPVLTLFRACRGGGRSTAKQPASPPPGPVIGELPVSRAARTVEFWLVIWSSFAYLGATGIVFLNLAQMCDALGTTLGGGGNNNSSLHALAQCVYTMAAAVGRLGSAAFVEALRLRRLPRPLAFAAVAAGALLGLLCLATHTTAGLYLGVLLCGAGYGGWWTLVPVIMGDLFGLKHLGAVYKATTVPEAAGYLLVGQRMTASLYQRAADAHGTGTACVGADCFRTACLVGCGLCATAVLACAELGRRVARREREREAGWLLGGAKACHHDEDDRRGE